MSRYLVVFKNGNLRSFNAKDYYEVVDRLTEEGYCECDWSAIYVKCGS